MKFNLPEEISSTFNSIEYFDKGTIKITLSQKYQSREHSVPFNPRFMKKSMESIVKRLQYLQLSETDLNILENTIYDNFLSNSDKLSKENQTDRDNENIKRKVIVNKYSQNRTSNLFESILLDGEHLFLNINEKGEISLLPSLEEKTRILYPPSTDEYLHQPYEFKSKQEIETTINAAKRETVFTFFRKAKSIVSKYVDQESHIINLIAVNMVFSYFQDRFNTVHYIGIFGDNGTGKSSIGDVAEASFYRPLNTTDPTAPNIFRSLGNIEPGQITLIMDEAERIDQSSDIIVTLKSGYSFNKKVSRINPNTGKPELFFPFCIKMIISERPPGPQIAKGVNERILGDVVYFGNPQYDIKEILNPTDTGEEEFKKAFTEIVEFRKLLLIYRMLHFNDHIRNIDIGLTGRNKELIKPYLQLFSDFQTEDDEKTYNELENTFQTLLRIKNNKKDFSLESALIPIIIKLMYESKLRKIKFSEFWQGMMNNIRGKLNENKPNEYNTEDYGTIYRNTISNTLQKLGVITKHHNSYTELIFEDKKVIRSASQYNISIQTNIQYFNGEHGERCEHPTGSETENTHDMYKRQSNDTIDSRIIDRKFPQCKINVPIKKGIENLGEINDDNSISTDQSSQFLIRPSDRELENKNRNNIYRIGKTDIWSCRNCKLKDDIHFMLKHPCRES